ncbi:hypothetical protein JB92DRAFT_2828596 [Gautieria morchelliformis]|nr:hypothetical protein JB92DRAFT_2828596 [Gautieria morchelliformis]
MNGVAKLPPECLLPVKKRLPYRGRDTPKMYIGGVVRVYLSNPPASPESWDYCKPTRGGDLLLPYSTLRAACMSVLLSIFGCDEPNVPFISDVAGTAPGSGKIFEHESQCVADLPIVNCACVLGLGVMGRERQTHSFRRLVVTEIIITYYTEHRADNSKDRSSNRYPKEAGNATGTVAISSAGMNERIGLF